MTDEKLLAIIRDYEDSLNIRFKGIKPAEKKFLAYQGLLPDHVAHIKSMFPRMREIIAEGRREKAMRWLGFIQGWLWAQGIYSVDELGKHNMPEASDG